MSHKDMQSQEYVSDRINLLLDLSGEYLPVNKGRASQVANEYRFGKTTVQKWIAPKSNAMPNRENAARLVKGCLSKIGRDNATTVNEVLMWLEFFPSAPNPFPANKKSPRQPRSKTNPKESAY